MIFLLLDYGNFLIKKFASSTMPTISIYVLINIEGLGWIVLRISRRFHIIFQSNRYLEAGDTKSLKSMLNYQELNQLHHRYRKFENFNLDTYPRKRRRSDSAL